MTRIVSASPDDMSLTALFIAKVVEEQPMIEALLDSLGNELTIESIERLSNEKVKNSCIKYFKELEPHISKVGSNCVIDKFPLNISSVPMIYNTFPRAKLILAVRHPLDSILSCWMQNFKLNQAMSNMVDLETIVDFYCYTMEIMELSDERYSLDLHKVRYEDLVLDMKSEVSSLLNFLSLNWESENLWI